MQKREKITVLNKEQLDAKIQNTVADGGKYSLHFLKTGDPVSMIKIYFPDGIIAMMNKQEIKEAIANIVSEKKMCPEGRITEETNIIKIVRKN